MQGDPNAPEDFDVAIDPLICDFETLCQEKQWGISDRDIADEVGRAADATDEFLRDLGLEAAPNKCYPFATTCALRKRLAKRVRLAGAPAGLPNG